MKSPIAAYRLQLWANDSPIVQAGIERRANIDSYCILDDGEWSCCGSSENYSDCIWMDDSSFRIHCALCIYAIPSQSFILPTSNPFRKWQNGHRGSSRCYTARLSVQKLIVLVNVGIDGINSSVRSAYLWYWQPVAELSKLHFCTWG